MALTIKVYGLGQKANVTGAIDVDTDTLKVALTNASHTPNQDTHDFRDDLTNELSGSGYAQQTLAGISVTYDSASDQVRLDCNDFAFSFSGSSTFRNLHVFKSRGGASSADELFFYGVWDSDQTVSTPYTIVIDPTGILYWDVT